MKHFIAEDFSALKKKRKSPTHLLRRGIKFLKKDHSKAIRLTGMIILVGAISYFLNQTDFWRGIYNRFYGAEKRNQAPSDNIVVPKITRANPGEIAEGFPKNLALNSKIEIAESYSAAYSDSSAKQATVEFISSKSPEANLIFYIQWAKDSGWDIVNSSEGDSISFLYFRKASEQINITIRASAKAAKSSDIVISYVDLNQ